MTEKMTVRETAAEIRKQLRARWPGTRFSVTMSRGTGHGWLDGRYTDGPPAAAVLAFTDGFRDMRFDGMDDGYHPINRGTRYRCNGVNWQRDYSPAAGEFARRVIAEQPGLYERPGDWIEPDGRNPAAERRVLTGFDLTGPTEGWDEQYRHNERKALR